MLFANTNILALRVNDKSSPDLQEFKTTGSIYALNAEQKIGHVKLFDNRRVEFSYDSIKGAQNKLKLKDEVDLTITLINGMLIAKELSLHSPKEKTTTKIETIELANAFASTFLDNDSHEHETLFNEEKQPIEQSAQKIYADAAVARAEGRFPAARELFTQAIEAGGGYQVYTAYAKMLIEGKGRDHAKARELLETAIKIYPDRPFLFDMFGQMERRSGNLPAAEIIFRSGVHLHNKHPLLLMGLAQVLSQMATTQSLHEAGEIFDFLDGIGKLNRRDNTYTRFRALASNPRAGRAYSFLDKITGFYPAIPGRRDLPPGISDLVLEIKDPDLDASFGVTGAYLVRCFSSDPKRTDILAFSKYMRSLKADSTIGLINGRDVVLNTSLAFVSIPKATSVRDFLMSVLSENNEAILPIDEQLMQSGEEPNEKIRNLLSQYLGLRDLYDSTLPVSGRKLFGREKLLVQVADQAHKGQFVGIFGLRKMGKTSLMYQLRDEKLKDEAVAYVDLQSSPGLSIASFLPVLWEIERDLLNRLQENHPAVSKILRLGVFSRYSDAIAAGLSPALVFSEDLRELLDSIANEELPGVSRVVIILDELERCLPLAGQQAMAGYLEFFSLLRGLAQTERYRGLLSSVVVAANAAISEKGYWEGRENPVFSLYKPLFVPPLSKPDTAQMIQNLGKSMSVYWEHSAIDAVFSECAGHPFLTRMLCSQISNRHLNRPLQITLRMVQDEIPVFIQDKSDKFEQITELLHSHFPEEERFLEQLALGKNIEDVSDETVRHLLGYQLIKRTRGGFAMSLNSLTSWLRKRAGVSQ